MKSASKALFIGFVASWFSLTCEAVVAQDVKFSTDFKEFSNAQERSMNFQKLPLGDGSEIFISAIGYVDENTVSEFNKFVEKENLSEGTWVVFNSGGGVSVAGRALGQEIRRRNFNTSVGYIPTSESSKRSEALTAICASACFSAFIGGVKRHLPSGSKLGVHRASEQQDGWSAPTYSALDVVIESMIDLSNHITQMGVSYEVAQIAMKTKFEKMHYFSDDELEKYNIITSKRALGEWRGVFRDGRVVFQNDAVENHRQLKFVFSKTNDRLMALDIDIGARKSAGLPGKGPCAGFLMIERLNKRTYSIAVESVKCKVNQDKSAKLSFILDRKTRVILSKNINLLELVIEDGAENLRLKPFSMPGSDHIDAM